MIRARAGHGPMRPARLLLSLLAGLAIVGGCVSGAPAASTTPEPGTPSMSGTPTDAGTPTADPGSPPPSDAPLASPTADGATTSPGPADIACTGDDNNREFFLLAAGAMSWPVYCAVLGEGWFLASGRYELADGGNLEVTYRGPGEAHIAIVEGTICTNGTDVESCAPRDALIGPATFGDRDAELGRLANGLVLDVDRGATPSWRATGLGLSEGDFRQIGANLVVVQD